MTALDLFTYDGHDVRVMNDDGALWFVASDVAKVFGYRMASDLTRTLDDDERGTRPVRTPSGVLLRQQRGPTLADTETAAA